MFIADFNVKAADTLAKELNQSGNAKAAATQVDVTDWKQQVQAFEKAIELFGRIDYVYPIAGIGEKTLFKNDPKSTGWEEPNLSVRCSRMKKKQD